MTAIVATAVSAASPPPAPSIRAIVLNPTRYLDQKVTRHRTVFRAETCSAIFPKRRRKSRYDFVLRSADAAIWVINMRPKGKEFDLALDARIDTNRWLDADAAQCSRGAACSGWTPKPARWRWRSRRPKRGEEEPIRVPAGPPPEVVFSAPTQDETDVLQGTTVRIQFSRDIDQATLKGHIRAAYPESQTVERGEPDTPAAEFTTQYNGANRVLELRFTKPLERFRTIKIDLLEGIVGTDGQPLKPWTLTFSIGGVLADSEFGTLELLDHAERRR